MPGAQRSGATSDTATARLERGRERLHLARARSAPWPLRARRRRRRVSSPQRRTSGPTARRTSRCAATPRRPRPRRSLVDREAHVRPGPVGVDGDRQRAGLAGRGHRGQRPLQQIRPRLDQGADASGRRGRPRTGRLRLGAQDALEQVARRAQALGLDVGDRAHAGHGIERRPRALRIRPAVVLRLAHQSPRQSFPQCLMSGVEYAHREEWIWARSPTSSGSTGRSRLQ